MVRVGKSLSPTEISKLRAVLIKNFDAFQWNPNEIGRTNLVEHSIPTGDSKPIQQRQYPIPSVARDFLRKQVDEMLENKFIRPSSSAWRSPVLLVKKKLNIMVRLINTYHLCCYLSSVRIDLRFRNVIKF